MMKRLTYTLTFALCCALPVSAAPKAAQPAKAPALSARDAAALDFYGVARNLQGGYELCEQRKAGNSENLKDVLDNMKSLSSAYDLGKQLYDRGERSTDIQKMEFDLNAKRKEFAQLSQDEVDSYCSLLGVSTIFTVQDMADALNQFAPAPVAPTPAAPTPATPTPLAPEPGPTTHDHH